MSGNVHVVPMREATDHDVSGPNCRCSPVLEAVFREDGSNGWMLTHNLFDNPRDGIPTCATDVLPLWHGVALLIVVVLLAMAVGMAVTA